MTNAHLPLRRLAMLRRRRPAIAVLTIVMLVSAVLCVQFASAAATYPADDFNNRTMSSWGSATVGGAYNYIGPRAQYYVGSGRGVMTAAPGIGRGAFVNAPTGDIQITAGITGPATGTGWGYAAYVTTRRVPGVGEYRARLHVDETGNVVLGIVRGNAKGSDVLIGTETAMPNLHLGPDSSLRLTLSTSGANPTTIRAKAWQDGEAVPAAWNLSVKDATAGIQGTGAVGIRMYNSSRATSNVAIQVFAWATSAPEPTTVPTQPTTPTTQAPPTTETPTTPEPTTTTTQKPTTTTAKPTPPTEPMPPTSDFGAKQLGTTTYPIPSGAFFVSPSGSDSSNGTANAPFKTLGKAVNAAPSGSTIVMRAGSYHESVQIYKKKLTIQSYPGEIVWMKGASEVQGWAGDGNIWRHDGWMTEFVNGDSNTFLKQYIDASKNKMSTFPDQVFRNGTSLTQVGSKAEVGPGKFYIDDAANAIYVGDNPNGARMEASDLPDAIYINGGHGSIVRGIGVTQYSTAIDRLAAIKGVADDVLFENLVVTRNAAAGISMYAGKNGKVLRSTASDNGQMGIHAHQFDNLVIQGNLLERNNTERMYSASAQGGFKITSSNGLLLADNLAQNNYGEGLWIDVSTTNSQVLRNIARDNQGDGIQVEISAHTLVAANYAYDNGGKGIYILESNDVDVFNNTTARNNRNIFVFEGTRESGIPDVSWNVNDVRVVNNIMYGVGNGGNLLFATDDAAHMQSAEDMNVSSDGNAYFRTSPTTPTWLVAWGDWPTKQRVYTTLADFSRETGNEKNGMSVDGGSEQFFVNPGGDDFTLKSGSVALGEGVPLPANIAAVLGVPAGTAVNIGVIG